MSRFLAIMSMALLLAALLPAGAAARAPQVPDADPAGLRLDKPIRSTARSPLAKLDRSLLGESRRIDAVVRLTAAPTSRVARGQVGRQLTRVNGQQNAVIAALRKLDGKAVFYGRTQVALNALLVRADAKALDRLAADGRVASINRVRDYALDLSETVPYIGASDVQDLGVDGSGIRVAVLDTGIDYTHAAMGGPGDVKSYEIAYGKKTTHQQNRMIKEAYKGKKLFPTAKVVGGWDFVGEAWPNGPLRSDPDPIDCSPAVIGCTGGHGTHVADIVGGVQDGKPGVAPGVEFYAVKVCSSVSPSCSGVALIQAMDFALDPNGDGNTSDAVDIINMSLGSTYGQSPDDDLSQAVENATAVGVLTVASAGNSGDKPYVTGTPAAAPTALSVAQTAVPSAIGFAMFITTSTGVQTREAVHQPWSGEFTEDHAVDDAVVQYGDGSGGNLNGCAAFAAGSLTDKVVLVDRGTCDFSLKISNIAIGGGKIGIIGLIAAGDPFEGGLGACPDNACAAIPGFMVSQSTANLLKNSANTLDFSPTSGIPLVMHMVGSSSRGPDNALNLIKPEVGAPGASVSAEVGTGTLNTPFGGTSGAAPMVSGSAALLMDAYPDRSPLEIKAALINTGETNIMNRPTEFGGELAPITRIGGGEVRVDRAHATGAAAWEQGGSSSALSFGFHDISADSGNSVTKSVTVRNYSGSSIEYDLASTFRFANDASNGAVSVDVPASVVVPAMGSATFDVTVEVDGSMLRGWSLDSGFAGANAAALQLLEYDGYIWLDAPGTDDDIHLPWQVLPRKAGDVSADDTSLDSGDSATLTNGGVGDAWIASFGLVATSDDDPDTGIGDVLADVDLRYVGVRSLTGDLATDVLACDAEWGLSFAVNTWNRQVHANAPALFEFDLDIDQDGNADFFVFNLDLALGALSDGRNVTWVQNAETGALSAFFFTAHSTNSANTILTICGEQLGLGPDAIGTEIDVLALAADWYNSGLVTDFAEFSMVIGGDRYDATFDNMETFFGPFSQLGGVSAPGLPETVTVVDNGATDTTPELGLLLTLDGSLFSPAGAPADNDAIVITVNEP